ncbi:hypothetical protein BN961_03558 [Afipia felis]|uniref:Uncharacterized protein n=1 Tax=Afipia felis TaxID=1035 RepID=A0A090N8J1_AFIFE|nr:hypothetical protein BN961_03558 [Afipia felis]
MRHQRAFDFRRAHAMTGDVDDVIDAAGDPVITVGIAAAAVAGEVLALVGGEVGLLETFVVAVDGAHLARPRFGDAQVAAAFALQHLAVGIDDLRHHAEERLGRRARLLCDGARQWRDHDAAGFGLPPGIDHRAAGITDHAVVPFPGFRVDRLADRAEQPQRFARGLLHRLVTGLHQRADRRRRGVEDVDLVLVDDVPEPRIVRIVRHAFEHHRGRAVGERPVQNVAVAGDPADVGGAPVDVAVVIIEDVLVRHRHEDQITGGGVQHAFRLSGRTRSVEDEQRIFRVHRLARAFAFDHGGGLVVPDVALRIHVDLAAGALDDDHPVHLAVDLLDRGIDVGLHRDGASAAQTLVGGDDDARLAVAQAAGDGVGREAAEHHRMDRADARAGEDRIRRLRDHRQIDGDAVALLDVAQPQDVGHLADFVVQLAIGDVARFRRIVALPDDGGLVAALLQMPVDAVVGGVENTILEPFDRDLAEFERGVLHLGERLDPVHPLGRLAPEPVRVLDRARVHVVVLCLIDIGAFGPLWRDWMDSLGHCLLPDRP